MGQGDSARTREGTVAETGHRPPDVPCVDVRTILGTGREAILVLGDAHYRLRLTSNGKLILTK